MPRRYLAPKKAILVTLGLVAAFLLVPAPGFASAHSCGDVWCDGNDGSTRYNSNGNDPQIYVGEVGTYLNDWNGPVHPCPSGVGGMCFLSGAADGAVTRYQNSTGISVHFYYFLGGPDSGRRPSGVTAYCWGWKQANAMFTDVGADFGKWDGWASVIFGDIEGGSTYGWDTTTQNANRDVLDGFRDNVANNSSQQPGNCNGGSHTSFQAGIYSSPSQWNSALAGTGDIPNLFEWTAVKCCTSTYPGDFTGTSTHYADWFGGNNHHFAWQYDEGPDRDIAKAGLNMPDLGYALGF
jgi:hypothetical protein